MERARRRERGARARAALLAAGALLALPLVWLHGRHHGAANCTRPAGAALAPAQVAAAATAAVPRAARGHVAISATEAALPAASPVVVPPAAHKCFHPCAHTVPKLVRPAEAAPLTRWKGHSVIDLPKPQTARGWRWLMASYVSVHWERTYASLHGDVYVFGVAGGNSVASMRAAFQEYGLPQPAVWGFDSFQGIPEEAGGVSRPVGWTRGTYDSSMDGFQCTRTQAGGLSCVETDKSRRLTFAEQVEKMDVEHGFDRRAVNFVQGFYNESLNLEMLENLDLKPALFVDIDCDLYISTFQALDWMFASGLIQVGTLIGYDDWCLTNLGSAGESLAHNEIAKKYKVTFACVVGGCTDAMMAPGRKKRYYNMISSKMNNPVFVVQSIGERAETGMDTYPRKCREQSISFIFR